MIVLTTKKLREILKKVNTDSKTRDIYSSKLNRIINFLRKNTGFKTAAVKEGGSRGKQTDTIKSDMDIIFCTSRDQNKNTIKIELLEKAKISFNKNAKVHSGSKAVHVDFIKPRCNIDLVYVTNQQFQQENKKIKKIAKMRPLHKNAIKLTKYALNKAKIDDIKGYEVELACIHLNDNNLPDCVFNLINYFSGRIKKKGSSLDKVLKFLV